jgi:hypothetical protein
VSGRDVQPVFAPVLAALGDAIREHYGDRLRALAVFGSVGRGTAGPDSDIDLLVVADDLPRGRLARVREFEAVERALNAAFAGSAMPPLSPIFKTPAELDAGSPLLLDMIEDSVVLVDRAGVLRTRLDRLRARLAELGAQRIWRGNAWYWDLKPDYRPGDVIEL